jgi:hypothetical protein
MPPRPRSRLLLSSRRRPLLLMLVMLDTAVAVEVEKQEANSDHDAKNIISPQFGCHTTAHRIRFGSEIHFANLHCSPRNYNHKTNILKPL